MAVAEGRTDPPTEHKGGNGDRENDSWAISPMSIDLIDNPIDFILAEHHRQREAAMLLTRIADGEYDAGGVEALRDFLEEDFALHIGDEEIALFPILREHCLPEDNVDRIMERLLAEHRDDETLGEETVEILNRLLAGESLTENAGRRLRRFAEHICQHLALENGVLLPIARVRLGVHVLDELADILRRRHSLG